MTVLERLENWRASGTITAEQYSAIAEIVRKDRFSVFIELNALLYLGVVLCVTGIGWTITKYFQNLGDTAIVVSLTLLFGLSFFYCFSRARPFTPQRTESPNLLFDYVLYLGTLVFAVEVAYIETRFEVLKNSWDTYLLISAVLYFFLAYRFDNRLVLSLALSTLAGWFGLSFTRFGILKTSNYRTPALIYAPLIAVIGTLLWQRGLKRHFLRAYLHLAANVLFIALLSGAVSAWREPYLLAILVTAGAAVYFGFRLREFTFAGYGTVYGYIGLSIWLLDRAPHNTRIVLGYFVASGLLVVGFLAWMAIKQARRS